MQTMEACGFTTIIKAKKTVVFDEAVEEPIFANAVVCPWQIAPAIEIVLWPPDEVTRRAPR